MMTTNLHIVVAIGAIGYFVFLMWKLFKSHDHIKDMLFPMIIGILFIIIALVPGFLSRISSFLGVQSEVNAIFLITIGILYFFVINLQAKIVEKQIQIKKLAQELALLKNKVEAKDNKEDEQ